MTVFLRLVETPIDQKAIVLRDNIRTMAGPNGSDEPAVHPLSYVFERDPATFAGVPGSSFAYWTTPRVREIFHRFARFESENRTVKQGLATADDFRFVRLWCEVANRVDGHRWFGFVKGGTFSRFYSDVPLLVGYSPADQVGLQAIGRFGRGATHYFRPGLTWPLRGAQLSVQAVPPGCIFSVAGKMAFAPVEQLPFFHGLMNAGIFTYLLRCLTDAVRIQFEAGLLQEMPVPPMTEPDATRLSVLARRGWSLKRTLNTVHEASHAFLLPHGLRLGIEAFDATAIDSELSRIQDEIDDLAFGLYGIAGEERAEIQRWLSIRSAPPDTGVSGPREADSDNDSEGEEPEADAGNNRDTLLSWTVGVAFGRFDIRLATGERAAPPEPEPFDPLPSRSPGMMPDDSLVRPIFVDDEGHKDDLPNAVSAVLARVSVPEPHDLRPWLAKEFFPLHIKMYSKSRRKAPIYWQLATPSASYSVWLYIHAFGKDTFYKVQNDYALPKLEHEQKKLDNLRREAGATPKPAERKALSTQEALVDELRTFLDEVKRIAPLWNPDLDDGVVLNFAPLWRLVPHHKPWQKEVKAAWEALCDGEYDWAHLAMHLWPERVVPKCATDRSLAIAHGLEETFWIEDAAGKWKPRAAPQTPVEDLVRERTFPAVKAALKSLLDAPVAQGTTKPARRKGAR